MKALEEHGNDLCAAMRSLHSEKKAEELANKESHAVAGGTFTADSDNHPASGDDWVALLIREVTQSTGIDDAKFRAAKVLEALEQTLSSRKIFQEVNLLVATLYCSLSFFLPLHHVSTWVGVLDAL